MPSLLAIGSDPEYFIASSETGGPVAPKEARIPGNKRAPKALMCGGKIHRDNACLELNIIPARTADELVNNMLAPKEEAELFYLRPFNNFLSDMQFLYIPEEWTRWKEIVMFGCDPSIDCWEIEQNTGFDSMNLFRSAGGHVHISYEGQTQEQSVRIARILDIKLGLKYSTLKERDNPRRNWYGSSGQMRFTPYGLEYRTLSNKWTLSETSIKDVFDICKDTVENFDGYFDILAKEYTGKQIKELFYRGTDEEVMACLSKFS